MKIKTASKFLAIALLSVGAGIGYSSAADAMNPNKGGQGNGNNDGGCRDVKGKFEAANLPPDQCSSPVGFCTEGELGKGNFKAGYSFVMSDTFSAGEPDAPGVNFFQGESLVTLPNNTVLVGIDTGAINLDPPGTLNSGRFSTLLTFTEGAAGHLWIRGTADLVNGTVSGSFDGVVCLED